MANRPVSKVIPFLRRTVLLPQGAGLTDEQLLSRFLDGRDEVAFAALLQRHGPMVWGVCHRLLANYQDAEDAFQATFLVLVRKAATVLPRERVGPWLYGVAYRTAQRGRVAAAKARRREQPFVELPAPAVAEADRWADLRPLLDQELTALPDRYRVVVVLCDLEGKTRTEVARELGLPEGTVASRLARARALLARRLAKHGRVLSSGALAAVLAQNGASASVPTSVVSATVKVARLCAAGQGVAPGVLRVKVAALTETVVQTMLRTRLAGVGTILVVLVVLASGVGTLSRSALATHPAETTKGDEGQVADPRQEGKEGTAQKQPKREKRSGHLQVDGIDLARGTITGSILHTNPERTFFSYVGGKWQLLVGPTTRITLDGKEAQLADLRTIKPHPDDTGWMRLVFVEWETEVQAGAKDKVRQGRAIRLEATGVQVRGRIQAVDVGKHTVATRRISWGFDGEVTEAKAVEVQVAKDVQVTINDKAARLADLKPDMKVSLQLSAVQELVLAIRAYGAKVDGVLKSVDARNNTLSVTLPSAQMTAEGVAVAREAKVVIDGKEGKLSDLRAGMRVTLHMSAEPAESLIIGVSKEKAADKE
jgi:RNA polymerase sigma factor (sigma-70 family)